MGPRIALLLALGSAVEIRLDPPDVGFLVKSRRGEADATPPGHVAFLLHQCPGPHQVLQVRPNGGGGGGERLRISEDGGSCGLRLSLVTPKVSFTRPSLRLLATLDPHLWTPIPGAKTRWPCVEVVATLGGAMVSGECQLHSRGGPDPACLIWIALPLGWWPDDHGTAVNPQVELRYRVKESYCAVAHYPEYRTPTLLPPEVILQTKLLPDTAQLLPITQEDFNDVSLMEGVSLLIPRTDIHAGQILTIPLRLSYHPLHSHPPIYLFQLRLEAGSGLRVLGVESGGGGGWSVEAELRPPFTSFSAAAFYRDHISPDSTWAGTVLTLLLQVMEDGVSEPFDKELSWFFTYELDNADPARRKRDIDNTTAASFESGNMTWTEGSTSLSATPTLNPLLGFWTTAVGKSRIAEQAVHVGTPLRVLKDAVAALAPVAQRSWLVNTGAVTGVGVSVPLRVWSVSELGVVKDVSLGAQCKALYASVLKVTPSCTSVYVDGSETRGAANASVVVSFGARAVVLSFAVWFPELPVEVWLRDPVLHSVRDWRLPVHQRIDLRRRRRLKRAQAQQISCTPRFQETEVKLYSRFRSDNTRTGETTYLGGQGRELLMDITHLTLMHLKSSDNKIATIYKQSEVGNRVILQGQSPGNVQVLLTSPFQASLTLGSGEAEVTTEPVSAKSLQAIAVADLSLQLLPSNSSNQPLDSQLHYALVKSRGVFHWKFQEGWVELAVSYSDGQSSALGDVRGSAFVLDGWSRDEASLAVTKSTFPTPDAGLGPQPKLLALDDRGKGARLDFELRSPTACQAADGSPILTASVYAETNFFPSDMEAPYQQSIELPPQIKELIQRRVDMEQASKPNFEQGQEIVAPDFFANGEDNSDTASDSSGIRNFSKAEMALYAVAAVGLVSAVLLAVHCAVVRASGEERGYKFHRLVPDFGRLWGGRQDAPCQEWVWLSPDQLSSNEPRAAPPRPNRRTYCACVGAGSPDEEMMLGPERSSSSAYGGRGSLGSRGSASLHSTASQPRVRPNPSNRISYQGSEISIHMRPEAPAGMEVRWPAWESMYEGRTELGPGGGRRTASWNSSRPHGGTRIRILPNPLPDSSSEQNLSAITPVQRSGRMGGAEGAKSEGDMGWERESLEMDETQLRSFFSSLRETNA